MIDFSEKNINFFNENGFIKIKNFLSKDKVNQILKIANEHLLKKIEPIETENSFHNISQKINPIPRRLRDVYFRNSIFKEWMENIEVHKIVEKLLQKNVTIELKHHNSIMTKIAHKSMSSEWHQDIRYWNFSDDNLISIWLALGKEDQLNGALELIPKSHKMIFKNEQFDDKNYFLQNYKDNLKSIKSKISYILNPGDIIFFHCKTLHRANKNITDYNKISFVYTLKSNETKYQNIN